MPITGDLVGGPKRKAELIDGLVADSKSPFAGLAGIVKLGVEVLSSVRMGIAIFQTVGGKAIK